MYCHGFIATYSAAILGSGPLVVVDFYKDSEHDLNQCDKELCMMTSMMLLCVSKRQVVC